MSCEINTLENVKKKLDQWLADPNLATKVTDLLMDICVVDTTPYPEVRIMRESEEKVFSRLRDELTDLDGEISFVPFNPAIESHQAFSLLHFTKTDECPEGLDFASTYEGRGNLLLKIKGDSIAPEKGSNAAVNAHVDVVAPFFPPRLENDVIYGRGSCDDKGSVVVMTIAAQLLQRLRNEGLKLNKNIVYMYVVEEETGGNGSLSLAIDSELKKEYDSMLVMEVASNDLHPANRGAVWYKSELRTSRLPKLLAASYCVLEMEKEGAAIKSESEHPMFPDRPVQTCHGMIGGFGEHPSRICGEVEFLVEKIMDAKALENFVTTAVEKYIQVYGDKTKVVDPSTGEVKVERHYSIAEEADMYRVTVFGSTGHMGSILENDGAITKMAYIVKEISDNYSLNDMPALLLQREPDEYGSLVLEGGQGFLPTHDIDEVMSRMANAAGRGLNECQKAFGADPDASCSTNYDKLHNNAFATDPDSPAMRSALKAMEICELRDPAKTIRGWQVSCDARLFANEHPGMPVVTSGAGLLGDAHSDAEKITIQELLDSVKFLVCYLLLETGSV